MQISNRFSVAVHIMLCVAAFSRDMKMTSELLASSVGVNPVVIRRILGNLKKAGLIGVTPGTGGAQILRSPGDITLLDMYLAVEPVDEGRLFSLHHRPNPVCPVGRAIHPLLEERTREAQNALERSLAKVSLASLLEEMERAGAATDKA